MICNTCQTHTTRIKVIDGVDSCPSCGGFSEVSNKAVDGLNSRNSLRVRSESVKMEGDTILPHKYDKASRSVTVNDEFVRLHPDKAINVYTASELKKAGYGKLNTLIAKQQAKRDAHKQARNTAVSFEGSASKAQKKLLQ